MSPTAAAKGDVVNELPPGIQDHVYLGKWYKHKGIRPLCLLLVIALITSSTNGFDGSMMNGLQAVDVWKVRFNNPQGSTKGLLNAVQNIGGLIGLPFCAYVNDYFGRRAGILLGSIIMLIGVAIQAASSKIGMFIGARGLIGFGLTFAQNAAPLLITELAYPTQRGPLTSLFNSLWYSGNIVAAWTTFGTFRIKNDWSWRIPTIMQALPSVIQVALIWFVPESPRWLISQGKNAQAQRILARYHTEDNNEQDPLVQFEMNEIINSLELEKMHSVSWLSIVGTPGNRRRMRVILGIAFFSQWSGNGFASYYLTDVLNAIGITSETIQTLYNGILALFNFGIAVGAAFMVDRVGRRTLFLVSTFGMTGAWLMWTTCQAVYSEKGQVSAGKAIMGIIFIYYFFYDIAYSPLLVAYTVEITPFAIRAKVLSLMNFFVSLSLIFNQYVNPVALPKLGWKYYLIYLFWLMFECAFIYLYLVETKNLTLEETSALFDGKEALAEVVPMNVRGVNAAREEEDDEKYDLSGEKGGNVRNLNELSGVQHIERV